jgi:HEAT repeats
LPSLAVICLIVLPVVVALARRFSLRPAVDPTISAVSRQHFELFQGSELNPLLVETAKARIRDMLERGDRAAVEASLRPGEQFVIHVRALTELGTDEAGQILERQLRRHFTNDHVEQTWYRIDVVSGLRQLNREECLPRLLACAEYAEQAPLGSVFAAETTGFLGFAGYLRQPGTPLGSAALRLLHRVLEGFRVCLPPQVAIEIRLGEMVEAVWDSRPDRPDPLVVRVLAEARRYIRRLPIAHKLLADDSSQRDGFLWQTSRLEAIDAAVDDYLTEVGPQLVRDIAGAHGARLDLLLETVRELRIESADVLLPFVVHPGFDRLERALNVLLWSNDPRVEGVVCRLIRKNVPLEPRAIRRKLLVRPCGRLSFPYAAALRALRRHYSRDAEAILLLASRDGHVPYRRAALESFGWFEPYRATEVIQALEECRRGHDADVRRAARAALGRLGERSALSWFRQGLSSEEPQYLHEAIQTIAHEGLVLLWPELDRFLDSADADLAYHAGEATVLLSEQMGK